MERLLALRPIFAATSLTTALDALKLPNGSLQYRLSATSRCSRVHLTGVDLAIPTGCMTQRNKKSRNPMNTKTPEREAYLQGKADGQDNFIQRILANWKQMRPLDLPKLRQQLLELKDEICDG